MGLQFPNSTGELNSPIPRGIGRQFLSPPPGKLELWMKLSGSLGERLQLGECCLPGFTPSLLGTRTRNEE